LYRIFLLTVGCDSSPGFGGNWQERKSELGIAVRNNAGKNCFALIDFTE